MQNYDKVQRIFIVLIILNINVLVLLVLLPNFTYAQEYRVLHQKTLYEIGKYTPSKQIAYIAVGISPSAIGVDPYTSTIYVANYVDKIL